MRLFPQLAFKFYSDKMCVSPTSSTLKLHSNYYLSCFLMTVQEAHKEYNSLMDKIRAKLDSGEFGSPGTPAFDVQACELANLLVRVSQLCTKLNLLTPKELYRPTFLKH